MNLRKTIVNNSLISGFKDQLPYNLGVIPFGVVFGAYAISIGISPVQAISFSLLVNAGSAQIAALGLFLENINPILIIFSIALINLRFMLYSASLAVKLYKLNSYWKLLLSYWLTDTTFLLILNKCQLDNPNEHKWYYFGVAFGQWSAWELSCALGVLLGPVIPASLSLGFALPLLFISLLMGHLSSKPMVVSAITSGILEVVLINLPNNLGLFFSILIGILVGLFIEQKQKTDRSTIPL